MHNKFRLECQGFNSVSHRGEYKLKISNLSITGTMYALLLYTPIRRLN